MARNSDSSSPTSNFTYFDDINADEDDDCVIFKGSPLYQSLLHNGYNVVEEEVTGCQKTDVRNVSLRDGKEEKDRIQMNSKSVSVSTRLSKLWMLIYEIIFHKERQRVQKNGRILQRLKKCSVLDEDDTDFLDWFIDLTDERTGENVNGTGQSKWLSIVITPVILSYIYMRTFNTTMAGKLIWLADILTIFFLLYAIIQILAIIIGAVRRRKNEIEIQCVDEFLSSSERLVIVFKRALRLIQEAELIARGFTLVSQRNPLSRLEESKKQTVRQCPTLRKLLFTCSRNSIYIFRQMTKQVLGLIPVTAEIDITSGYLAFEPLENYGPCLQMAPDDSKSEVHLYRLTDGFSVSALKGISHLMMLHMSEFIKAMAVFYHYTNKYRDMNHSNVLMIVTQLTSDVTKWTDSVQLSIDFHNSSLIKKEREDRQMEEKNEYSDLYVAIHSLDLHLQSALTRVRSLATDIESHMAMKDNSILSHDQMNEQMQPIKAELTSCNSCYTDAMSRLEYLCGKADLKEERNDIKIDSTWKDKEKPRTKIKELDNYIIVDQVFEAYTDPDEIGLGDTDWEQPLTAEEKEKKRREKEEAVRMLSELKSVIKVRAKETEKRETAALNRARMGNKRLSVEMERETQEVRQDDDLVRKVEEISVSGDRIRQHRLHNEQRVEDELISNKRDGATISINSNQENVDYNEAFMVKEYDIENGHKDDRDSIANEIREIEAEGSEIGTPSYTCDSCVSEAKSSDDVSIIGSDHSHDIDQSDVIHPRIYEFRTKSIVTQLGVRRLRKGTMLDDSDSDEDIVVKGCDGVPKVSLISNDSNVSLDANLVRTTEALRKTKVSSVDDRNISCSDLNDSVKVKETSSSDLIDKTESGKQYESQNRDDCAEKEADVKHDRTEGCVRFSDNSEEFIAEDESYNTQTDYKTIDTEVNDCVSNTSPSSLSLEERLAKLSGLDFNLTSNIALMAAARSKEFVKSQETTFGGDVFGEMSDSDSEVGERYEFH